MVTKSKFLLQKILLLFFLVSFCEANAQISYYLIGDISGNIEPTVENAEALKDYILPIGECKIFNIPAGKFDFYLCSDLSNPSNSSIGAIDGLDELFINGYGEIYADVEPGSTIHWTIKDWEGGNVIMYYDESNIFKMRSLPHSGVLNIFGSLNNWTIDSPSSYILTETSPGSLIYTGKYKLSGTTSFGFCFLSSEGWMSNISRMAFDNSSLPLSFNREGVASGAIKFANDTNWGQILGLDSEVEFVVDLNNMTANLIGGNDYARRSLYLAGVCDQAPIAENAHIYEAWSLYETSSGSNEYKGTFNIPAGKFDLCLFPELTSEGWNSQALCAGKNDVNIAVNEYGVSLCDTKLMTGNNGHWILPEWAGGDVSITVNLNDSTICFDIPSLMGDMFFLVGNMTNWLSPTLNNVDFYKNWTLSETQKGNKIYENVFEMPSGSLTFRFYKELTGWDEGASYGSQSTDSPIAISLTNDTYSGQIMKGKGSWNISDFPGGKMRITINLNNSTISFNTADLLPNVIEVDGIIYSKKSTSEVSVSSKGGGYAGNIVIPDTIEYQDMKLAVTSIDNNAFNDCDELYSVSISATITGNFFSKFATCDNLEAINVNENHETYCSIDGVIFNKDLSAIIYCPKGKTGDYVIPEGVMTIGNKYDGGIFGIQYEVAFENCKKLTSITIPNSVANISPDKEFRDCSQLLEFNVSNNNNTFASIDGVLTTKDNTTIIYYPAGKPGSYIIPNVVTTINSMAFYGSAITSITIHKNVSAIGSLAFYNCPNLETINFDAKDCHINAYGVGWDVYFNCPIIKHINIGENVERLRHGIFSNCGDVRTIEIPNNVISLDGGTIIGSNIETIKIGSGVTGRICGAFDCPQLNSIEVSPNNPAYTSIDGILFTKDMTTLVQYPAAKEGSIYQIPESVTTLEGYAFYYCSKLESIGISALVSTIPDRAFYSCSSLKNIAIPNSVSLIGMESFAYCQELKSIVIPESVDSIARGAFVECINLTEIVSLNKTAPICGSTDVFGYGYYPAFSDINVYVPAGAAEAYKNATTWNNLSIIENATATLNVTKNIAKAGELSVPSVIIVGECITIEATPTQGYKFNVWSQNGLTLCKEPSFSFIAPLSCNIVAEFIPITNDNNVEVSTSQPNEATLNFASESGATGYIVNLYSDAEMTQLVATQEYDNNGNIVPMSNNISISFSDLDGGTYFYELIVKSQVDADNCELLSKYIGSFNVEAASVNNIKYSEIRCNLNSLGIEIANATGLEILVCDIFGRILSHEVVSADLVNIPLNKGIYVVKIGEYTYKVILH